MQELHRISAEIQRLSMHLEREIREITLLNKRLNATEANQSVKIDSLQQHIDRIDRKIDRILAKIQSIEQSIQSTEAIQSNQSVGWGQKEKSEISRREDIFKETTARERQVLGILFNYGILSYREIAGYLNITARTAKGLVKRILEDPQKNRLVLKHREGRELRVGLAPEVEQRILAKKKQQEQGLEAGND